MLVSAGVQSSVWGPVIFATLTPIAAATLAGVVRLFVHMGRHDQRISNVEEDVHEIKEDVRSMRQER